MCLSEREYLKSLSADSTVLNDSGFSSLCYIYFGGVMRCSSVLEFYFSYLTCSVSPAAPGNYGAELLRSPDPLLECTFSSTHQSPSAHYLWSLDDIAQFCMSNSHFSPIKFSLHDILDYWWKLEEVVLPLWSLIVWLFDTEQQ